jgi:O-antigen ligase
MFSIKYILLFSAIVIILGVVGGDTIKIAYDSIFSSDGADVHGSTKEMRETQFTVGLFYFFQSPIWGQGASFDIYDYESQGEIFGMESELLKILFQRGLIGFSAYLIVVILPVVQLIKKTKHWGYIGFPLSWLIMNLLSSQEGVSLYHYMLTMCILFCFALNYKKRYEIKFNSSCIQH